ncbi:MAG TPA: cupin domain-containing protein [Gemmatimonadaceae bacterium]|nr:cupin domain-containing protein [Gemmatimonadaceae bacterium]
MPATTNDAATNDRVIRFLGNNQVNVLVSSEETRGKFCVLEAIIEPRGGATALHTDRWLETFHVLEGEVEWTVERDGQLVTWTATRGETITVQPGVKHRWAGAGDTPSRMLTVGLPEFEDFFRALAAAWEGPYDREKTPMAVGPVFARFGMELCAA